MRQGSVLILVTWVVVVLSLVMTTFLRESLVEARVSSYRQDSLVLRQAAESSLERVIGYLSTNETTGEDGRPLWLNDPDSFQDVAIGNVEVSIYYRDLETGELRYGLSDEASRIHLFSADESMLGALPLDALSDETDRIVDGILDWVDEDSNPRPDGAENEEYALLSPPQEPRNGLPETLSELLLVPGVTPLVFYGEDINRNARLDANESDGEDRWPADNGDSELDPGLIDYLTVYSYEKNVDSDGVKRLDINQASEEDFYSRLGSKIGSRKVNRILQVRRSVNFTSIGQLLDVPGFSSGDFKKIVDIVTVQSETFIPGRINVVTAPPEVLAVLPGMTEELVEELVEVRSSGEDGVDLSTIGWVLSVVGKQRFQLIAERMTTRSSQYRIHVVARFKADDSGRRPPGMVRLRVVLDMAGTKPRFLQYQDWTHRGPVFPLEEESYSVR